MLSNAFNITITYVKVQDYEFLVHKFPKSFHFKEIMNYSHIQNHTNYFLV